MYEMKQVWIDQVVSLTLQASDAILSVYNDVSACEVELKADQSPVTAADLAAHHIIMEGLQALLPEVPILSEEGDMANFDERSQWPRYWLVDPLDGTKEFIQRNGEFTVNIALIEAGRPIFGVVTVPVTGVVYWGAKALGAYKMVDGVSTPLSVRTVNARLEQQQAIEVVASRRHGGEGIETLKTVLAEHFPRVEYKNMGSSLKLCLIAEGKADCYPRLAPTCEWDTAAAQAVVEAAGGAVVDNQFHRLDYNTKSSLLNPFFYVIADTSYPWQELLLSPKST
jgi:3'(2'), 5'-bisphosphate nucleotidase